MIVGALVREFLTDSWPSFGGWRQAFHGLRGLDALFLFVTSCTGCIRQKEQGREREREGEGERASQDSISRAAGGFQQFESVDVMPSEYGEA